MYLCSYVLVQSSFDSSVYLSEGRKDTAFTYQVAFWCIRGLPPHLWRSLHTCWPPLCCWWYAKSDCRELYYDDASLLVVIGLLLVPASWLIFYPVIWGLHVRPYFVVVVPSITRLYCSICCSCRMIHVLSVCVQVGSPHLCSCGVLKQSSRWQSHNGSSRPWADNDCNLREGG